MFRTLISICLILAIYYSYGQDLNFRNYSIKEGLPQSSANCIYQDKKGFLWFGTQGGASKFNGKEFTNFNQSNGLGGNHVNSIGQDINGYIWFGHRYSGISCQHNNNILTFKPKDLKGSIKSITKWEKGILANTDNNNIFYFEIKNEEIVLSENIKTSSYNFLETNKVKSKDKDLFIATDKGLFILDKSFKTKHNLLPKSNVYDFKWDKDKNLVILTDHGIRILSNKYKEIEYIKTNETYTVIEVDNENKIWLGSAIHGAISIENKKNKRIQKKISLPTNEVNDIIIDTEGSKWFGLDGKGVSQLLPVKFRSYNKKNGLKNDQIQSILMDHKSRLWVSGKGSLDVLEFNDKESFITKSVTNLSQILEKGFSNAMSIYEDKRHWVWLGTNHGVYVLNENFKIIHRLIKKDGLSNNFIISITEDLKGNIWLASLFHGVTKVEIINNKLNCKAFDKETGLCSNKFWTAFTDSKGLVYLGSNDNGISVWDGNDFSTINKKQGLTNLRAGSITEDKNGNIWVGTIGGGIYKYNGKKCINFNSKNGLSSDNPYLVMADGYGNIWIGTNTGVDVMSIDQKEDTTYFKNLFKHYGINRGFTGVETNQNSKYKDEKGNLWFGTVSGVMQCNALEIQSDTTPPNISISDTKLFLRESLQSNRHKLNYKQNHLTFEYIGILYSSPNEVKYKYKLEGFDEDWSPWTKRNYATYSYLPPGNFSFKLKASNGDNYESKVIQYDFNIIPPFWNTIWFYFMCIVLTIASMFFIIWLRTKRAEKARKKLELKVEKRTKQLNDEKQKVIKQKNVIEEKTKEIEVQNTNLSVYLEIISTFAHTIQEGDNEDDIVWAVAKNAIAELGYEDCVIYLLAGDGKYMVQRAAHGNKNPDKREILDPIKIKIGDGIVGTVAETGVPELINDTSKDERYILDDIPRLSEITVPIVHNKQVIGVIDSEHPEKNFYPEGHLELLSTIASMTATKLVQTKFNNELKKYQNKLEGLVDKRTKELKGKTLEVEEQNIKLQQLALFPEHNPNPVIELNFEYKVIYINPGAKKHFKDTPLLSLSDPARKKYEDLLSFTRKDKKTGVYTIDEGFIINNKHYGFNLYIDNEYRILRLYFNDITDIKRMQSELKEQRDSIYDSLNYAQRIQRAILPELSFLNKYFEDHFVIYEPKDIVSGDFYWSTEHNENLLLAMCDCTGHGVPGAFMSIIGHNALNDIIKYKDFTVTSDILNALNSYFYKSREESRNTVMDSMDMIICHYNKQSKTLNFSGCLQQLYLIRDGEVHIYRTDNIPLGLKIDGDGFSSENIDLKKGDLIYLFSDGYPDQFGGPRGKKFKYKPFRDLLISIHEKPMSEQQETLINTMNIWRKDHGIIHEQIDDISIIGLKV